VSAYCMLMLSCVCVAALRRADPRARNLPAVSSIKITPWLQSASDRLLSAKLVPAFADRGMPSGQRGGSPTAAISVFFQVAPRLYSRGRVAPFQTHYFSENMVAPGIEPGRLTTRSQRRSVYRIKKLKKAAKTEQRAVEL
jgi:hypothetical protein